MTTLARAIAIAAQVHDGQVDKAGSPYILHPLRVMMRMSSDVERIAAVLHDVVEDGAGWSFERLRSEGFAPDVIEALRAVSKRPDEEDTATDTENDKTERYLRFIRRAAGHPIGRRVKRADLEDNSDLGRIAQPTANDLQRVAKYRRALALLDAIERGEADAP